MDKVETTCKYCGKKFYAELHDLKKGKSAYCSKTCFYEVCRKRRCKYPGCNKAHFGLGYCKNHYRQLPEVKKREKEKRLVWYKAKPLSHHNEIRRRWYEKIRNTILMHYSNGTLKCAKCGFDDVRALDIDHINNNAREDKKKFGTNVYCFYIDLAKKLPEGYQVLCRNCNWIKHIENTRSKYGRKDQAHI